MRIKEYIETNMPNMKFVKSADLYQEGISFKYLPNDKDYSIDDAILIGITGSYGKSSAAYLLYDYLNKNGYRAVCHSSIGIFNPCSFTKKNSATNKPMSYKETLSLFLAQAEAYKAEFIILEVNELSIMKGLYDDLDFDLKVLVSFKDGHNKHLSIDKYFNTKKEFLSNRPTKTLLNIEADRIGSFLSIFDDLNVDVQLFGIGDIGCLDYSSKLEDFKKISDKVVNVYPIFKLGSVGYSYFEYNLNNLNYSCRTTLSMDIGVNMSIILISMLNALGMYEKELIDTYLLNSAYVPGRCEDIDWNGRNIIIDSGDSDVFIQKIINELEHPNLQLAKQEYKNRYGEEFTKDINSIRVFLSLVSWVSDSTMGSLRAMQEDGMFTFINPTANMGEIGRKYYLTFGLNLYKLTHKLDTVRDSFCFNEVIEEIGLDNILNYSDCTAFDTEYLENLYNCLVLSISEIDSTSYKFNLNFAWRSIFGLKSFFSNNIDDFVRVTEYFKTLGNQFLNDACDYLLSNIEIVNKNFEKSTNVINSIAESSKIKKVYVTQNNEDAVSGKFDLNKTARYLKFNNYVVIPNRKTAIKAILQESQEGDLILITGRGNISNYRNADGSVESFSDSQYIKKVIRNQEV